MDGVVKKIEEKGWHALAILGGVSEESVVDDMIKRKVSTLGVSPPSIFARFVAGCDDALLNVFVLTQCPGGRCR